MTITIKYASKRSEVWRYYWRIWRHGLWKIHSFVFITTTTLFYLIICQHDFFKLSELLKATIIGLLPVIGFILFPMLAFKPQIRTLLVDYRGISTSIGKHRAEIPWDDIASFHDDGTALTIQRRNGNAFIVPARAFRLDQDKAAFVGFIRTHLRPNATGRH